MKTETQFIEIYHQLSLEERNEIGSRIAKLSQQMSETEAEKKSAMSDYNHQIDSLKALFKEDVNLLNNGFEMRNIRVRRIKNYQTKEVEYYDAETFHLVKQEPFKARDYQIDVEDVVPEKPVYGPVTEPTPTDNGTLADNPDRYAHLLRELNFWRNSFEDITKTDDVDQQIEQGLLIHNKIKELEIALKAMEKTPKEETSEPTDSVSETPTNQAESTDATTTDESDPESKD